MGATAPRVGDAFHVGDGDDAPDQVLVGRLARILYGRRRAKTENRLTAEAPFPPPVERVEPAEPDSGFGSDIA